MSRGRVLVFPMEVAMGRFRSAILMGLMISFPGFSSLAADAPTASPSDRDLTLTCLTMPLTTSYMVFPEGDLLVVEIFHHNGTALAPFHEGVVVPRDLPILTERAAILGKLSNYTRVEFPREKCKVLQEKILHCQNYKAPERDINGLKVAFLSFMTSLNTEVSPAGTFKSLGTNLFVSVNGKTYFLPMKYDVDQCVQRRRPF